MTDYNRSQTQQGNQQPKNPASQSPSSQQKRDDRSAPLRDSEKR